MSKHTFKTSWRRELQPLSFFVTAVFLTLVPRRLKRFEPQQAEESTMQPSKPYVDQVKSMKQDHKSTLFVDYSHIPSSLQDQIQKNYYRFVQQAVAVTLPAANQFVCAGSNLICSGQCRTLCGRWTMSTRRTSAAMLANSTSAFTTLTASPSASSCAEVL